MTHVTHPTPTDLSTALERARVERARAFHTGLKVLRTRLGRRAPTRVPHHV